MNKVFVEKSGLSLKNSAYLVAEGKPVFHKEFVDAQKAAERIVKFAELAKGKNFKNIEGVSVSKLWVDVDTALKAKDITYVSIPEAPKQTLNEQLKSEALAFKDFLGNKGKAELINAAMSQFNIINEFEEIGLYFEEAVCKLNKIYTIEEIKVAVSSVIELL